MFQQLFIHLWRAKRTWKTKDPQKNKALESTPSSSSSSSPSSSRNQIQPPSSSIFFFYFKLHKSNTTTIFFYLLLLQALFFPAPSAKLKIPQNTLQPIIIIHPPPFLFKLTSSSFFWQLKSFVLHFLFLFQKFSLINKKTKHQTKISTF
jgi:hypothetical protein